ncbi:MAG: hypothetical protein BWK80_57980 [Desulfobacteraceae bacterium IS3]|nr:MAG: hypothetical protein BWK80_57980 [Desulfobacteraceae bacterium IS3]
MNKRQIKDIALASIPFLFLVILWGVTAYFNWMPNWFLPYPSEVALSFCELIKNGTILKLFIESAFNLIPPFLLAITTSITLGIIIGTNTTARKIFFPFISSFYPIPSLAWLPFIIIIFGFTRESVWVLLFISSFLKMIYNMVVGVRNVNTFWILVAKNLGLNKLQIIFNVVIPGALPNIITGMRIGFGSIWRSLIAAEMLVSGAGGLGKFVWTAQWTFSFEKVFAGILMIAIIGLTVEILVFKKIEAITLTKWGLIDGDA